MSRSHLRPTTALSLSLLLALALCAGLLPAAEAQEGPGSGKAAWEEAEAVRTGGDTVSAFKAYETLLAQFPTDNIYAPMALYRMCMLRYQAQNIPEALAYALKMSTEYPDANACKSGYAAFYLTAIYLVFQKNPQAVVDLVKGHIDNYAPNLNGWEWCAALTRVAQAYVQLGKTKEAREFLTARLPQCLLLLTYPDYYETLVQIALAEKDNAAALAAARQGYALCDFDEAKIKQMANLVRRTYMGTGDFSKGLQFLASQDDPQAPNPLKDVPAAKVSEQEKAALLQAVGSKLDQRTVVELYCGDHKQALADAILFLSQATDKDAVKSIMGVARVFKAVDLSVHRANQFIEFARTGKGVNPAVEPGF